MNGITKKTTIERYRDQTTNYHGVTFNVYMKSGHVLRLDNVTQVVTNEQGNYLIEFTQGSNPTEEFFYIDISKDTVDAVSKVNQTKPVVAQTTPQKYIPKSLCELNVGDLVDLEGDSVADPDRTNANYKATLVQVRSIENVDKADFLVYFADGKVFDYDISHQFKCRMP